MTTDVVNHQWAKSIKETVKNGSTLFPRLLKYLNGQDFLIVEAYGNERKNRRLADKHRFCMSNLYLVPVRSFGSNPKKALTCTPFNNIVINRNPISKRVPLLRMFEAGTKFRDVTGEFKQEYEKYGMCSYTDDRHTWKPKPGTKTIKVCSTCGLVERRYVRWVRRTESKYK